MAQNRRDARADRRRHRTRGEGSHAGAGVPALRRGRGRRDLAARSEEHTSELQSRQYLVCRLLLEKKKAIKDSSHGGHNREHTTSGRGTHHDENVVKDNTNLLHMCECCYYNRGISEVYRSEEYTSA